MKLGQEGFIVRDRCTFAPELKGRVLYAEHFGLNPVSHQPQERVTMTILFPTTEDYTQ